MEGLGEEKLYFLLLKSVKGKKAQFRAKCLNSFYRPLFRAKCLNSFYRPLFRAKCLNSFCRPLFRAKCLNSFCRRLQALLMFSRASRGAKGDGNFCCAPKRIIIKIKNAKAHGKEQRETLNESFVSSIFSWRGYETRWILK